MKKQEFTYLSADGITQIHAVEWIPEKPRAIVQIAHGMVEFIDRYDNFARWLAEHGILVVGNDHLGHGRSVIDNEHLGYFAENGNDCVIQDLRKLQYSTREKYPGLPYIFLGHSMGSFLARQFISMYSDSLEGAIIMGTADQPRAALEFLKTASALLAKKYGWMYRSPALTKIALGSNNKQFEPARTRNDWLTKDEAIVDAYNANPLNNFMFTVNAFYNMAEGLEYADKHIYSIRKSLPILFISGADDPVGKNGVGVKAVYDKFIDAGISDVQLRLYENDRHEVLNETNRIQVYNDLYEWMQKHCNV
ncbi:MAG: alpha/beta fold hydrolase [Catenisphaera adipataccumulans]|jgi:alpha-beta hydrolase superfamily lysophospholipase|uniref:alpha/beta fold hydrolase n=1 Tax=Catenisphaera adipataccumulans TaxID=700500 RepID=UPI003D91AEA1